MNYISNSHNLHKGSSGHHGGKDIHSDVYMNQKNGSVIDKSIDEENLSMKKGDTSGFVSDEEGDSKDYGSDTEDSEMDDDDAKGTSSVKCSKVMEASPKGRFERFNQEIGSGAYKNVYRAIDHDTGREVAWNVIRLERLPTGDKKRISEEIKLIKVLKHPNIIHFIGAWINKEKEELVFVTEIVTSSLRQYLQKIKSPRLKVIKHWCREILNGIKYLHEQKPFPIIHRDIKCDNIFINSNSGDIRIGDLGLSTSLTHSYTTSVLGTPEFMAPEVYEENYATSVDIYAFGMCLLEMATLQTPYKECSNAAQIYKKVISGIKPKSLLRIEDKKLRRFIILCISKAEERPTVEELLNSEFLTDLESEENWNSIKLKPANYQKKQAPHSASSPILEPYSSSCNEATGTSKENEKRKKIERNNSDIKFLNRCDAKKNKKISDAGLENLSEKDEEDSDIEDNETSQWEERKKSINYLTQNYYSPDQESVMGIEGITKLKRYKSEYESVDDNTKVNPEIFERKDHDKLSTSEDSCSAKKDKFNAKKDGEQAPKMPEKEASMKTAPTIFDITPRSAGLDEDHAQQPLKSLQSLPALTKVPSTTQTLLAEQSSQDNLLNKSCLKVNVIKKQEGEDPNIIHMRLIVSTKGIPKEVTFDFNLKSDTADGVASEMTEALGFTKREEDKIAIEIKMLLARGTIFASPKSAMSAQAPPPLLQKQESVSKLEEGITRQNSVKSTNSSQPTTSKRSEVISSEKTSTVAPTTPKRQKISSEQDRQLQMLLSNLEEIKENIISESIRLEQCEIPHTLSNEEKLEIQYICEMSSLLMQHKEQLEELRRRTECAKTRNPQCPTNYNEEKKGLPVKRDSLVEIPTFPVKSLKLPSRLHGVIDPDSPNNNISDIKMLQSAFSIIENDKNAQIDGVYDQFTLRSVIAFQKKNNCPIDGVVNNDLWEKIIKSAEYITCKVKEEVMKTQSTVKQESPLSARTNSTRNERKNCKSLICPQPAPNPNLLIENHR